MSTDPCRKYSTPERLCDDIYCRDFALHKGELYLLEDDLSTIRVFEAALDRLQPSSPSLILSPLRYIRTAGVTWIGGLESDGERLFGMTEITLGNQTVYSAHIVDPLSGESKFSTVLDVPIDWERTNHLVAVRDKSIFQLGNDGGLTVFNSFKTFQKYLGDDALLPVEALEFYLLDRKFIGHQAIVKDADGCVLVLDAADGKLSLYGRDLGLSRELGTLFVPTESMFVRLWLDDQRGLLYIDKQTKTECRCNLSVYSVLKYFPDKTG